MDQRKQSGQPPAWKRLGERAPRRGGAARACFQPWHKDTLRTLLREIDAWLCSHPDRPMDNAALHPLLRRNPRDGSGFFSRSQLIAAARALGPSLDLSTPIEALAAQLRMKPVRSLSGVAPVTVFTRPFPCPGRCVFCPNDVRMPKSYLSDEPGAQRAEDNRFDPYLQTYNRLRTYADLGHPIDKVELLVLGGTWTHYPRDYRRWFITRCFEALNDLGNGVDHRAAAGHTDLNFESLPRQLKGLALKRGYNERVSRHVKAQLGSLLSDEEREGPLEALRAAQQHNESGAARCVGLVVETRPDELSAPVLEELRLLGVTKVQLGLQSICDRVLSLNQRGHDVQQARDAIRMLRGAGFKVLAHWMPNLLGSTPEQDRQDFERLFTDRDFRPDELKIYPCSLVESAELMTFHASGDWRPYTEDDLLEVLEHALEHTPRYCRLTRVIRDISSDDIVTGNRRTNLRQRAEAGLAERQVQLVEIRTRELRDAPCEADALTLRDTRYRQSVGEEHFLELVTHEDRLAGFLRLSLPERQAELQELEGAALIRELHVYGPSLALGARQRGAAQHLGLGRRLLQAAASRATRAAHLRLSVISAVGTRSYYRSLGFTDGALYQHLELGADMVALSP